MGMLCLIAGVVLIALELFVVPGFGVTGISGIIAIAIALTGAMTSNDAVTGFDLGALGSSLLIVGAGCLLALVLVWYLTSSHGPDCSGTLRTHDRAFCCRRICRRRPVAGTSGWSACHLCNSTPPRRKITVGHDVYDAVSTGSFIAANRHVKNCKIRKCPTLRD